MGHGLSQQGAWVPFWTPKPLERNPQDTQIFLCGISKNLNLKLIIEFFHLLIIPMTLINDITPYFDEFIHVYGWNMSILWSPFKIWTPKIFTTANFRHPVSKSWLRHCKCGVHSSNLLLFDNSGYINYIIVWKILWWGIHSAPQGIHIFQMVNDYGPGTIKLQAKEEKINTEGRVSYFSQILLHSN